jgi:hypothetical protein
MQITDQEVVQKVLEDDPDYIDPLHIPAAEAMVLRLVYVHGRVDVC